MRVAWAAVLWCVCFAVQAQPRVVDIPTRAGVTQRFLYLAPAKPKAAAIFFPGGAGDFQVANDASITRQSISFMVRTRDLFAAQGIAVAIVSPPSDRSNLEFFRETREHAEDVRAVIAWVRREAGVPVWLIGTSRGTLSAGYVAAQLAPRDGGPDGVVLTSSVLVRTPRMQEAVVPDLALERITVPVLIVHHKQDSCRSCPPGVVPSVIERLTAAPRKEFIPAEGGASEGPPCEPMAHHGYNGIEREVVGKIAEWMLR